MRKLWAGQALVACLTFVAAYPAESRVTVVDGGQTMTVGGYCTPGTPVASDCAPQALPFAVTLGGTTYNSFILNGNGTLTLGNTGIDWNTVSNSAPNLSTYPMPVFSPETDNTITTRTIQDIEHATSSQEADTRWAASVTTVPNTSLTAYWFPCVTAIFCGTNSLSAELYDGPLTEAQVIERQSWGMFGLRMTSLGPDSFQLDYFYNPVYVLGPNFEDLLVTDPQGTYGFNVAGGPSLQQTGSLVNRSWIFDNAGVRAVPEPASWMMMLLGFAGLGLAFRRNQRRELRPA